MEPRNPAEGVAPIPDEAIAVGDSAGTGHEAPTRDAVLTAALSAGSGSAENLGGALLLEARQVTKQFGGLLAVATVDFTIPARSIVALIGPNGAGKTTFFNIITGLYVPTGGTLTFAGQNLAGRRPDEVVEIGDRAAPSRTFACSPT